MNCFQGFLSMPPPVLLQLMPSGPTTSNSDFCSFGLVDSVATSFERIVRHES